MPDTRRRAALVAALEATLPLAELQAGLAAFPWDSEPLVVLQRDHVVGALRRVISGERTFRDVAQWADLLEGRDDVDLERGYESALKEIIFELANPGTQGRIDRAQAQSLIERLSVT